MHQLDKSLGSARRRAVLAELKQSSGMSVKELAARIGLSYMGAKQHCIELEKKGLLKSRNQHRAIGRPNLIYTLTEKAQQVFENPEGNIAESLLRQAKSLFGPTAPGKLLYLYFQERTAWYLEKLPADASVEDRLKALADLRRREGFMSRAEGRSLVEFHSPLRSLFAAYPEALGMEETMLAKVSGLPLKRREIVAEGQREIRFEA